MDAPAPAPGSVHQESCFTPYAGGVSLADGSSLRRRPLLGALALVGLAAAFLVAFVLGSAPGGHRATAVEWTIQVLILFGAFLMLAGRAARS